MKLVIMRCYTHEGSAMYSVYIQQLLAKRGVSSGQVRVEVSTVGGRQFEIYTTPSGERFIDLKRENDPKLISLIREIWPVTIFTLTLNWETVLQEAKADLKSSLSEDIPSHIISILVIDFCEKMGNALHPLQYYLSDPKQMARTEVKELYSLLVDLRWTVVALIWASRWSLILTGKNSGETTQDEENDPSVNYRSVLIEYAATDLAVLRINQDEGRDIYTSNELRTSHAKRTLLTKMEEILKQVEQHSFDGSAVQMKFLRLLSSLFSFAKNNLVKLILKLEALEKKCQEDQQLTRVKSCLKEFINTTNELITQFDEFVSYLDSQKKHRINRFTALLITFVLWQTNKLGRDQLLPSFLKRRASEHQTYLLSDGDILGSIPLQLRDGHISTGDAANKITSTLDNSVSTLTNIQNSSGSVSHHEVKQESALDTVRLITLKTLINEAFDNLARGRDDQALRFCFTVLQLLPDECFSEHPESNESLEPFVEAMDLATLIIEYVENKDRLPDPERRRAKRFIAFLHRNHFASLSTLRDLEAYLHFVEESFEDEEKGEVTKSEFEKLLTFIGRVRDLTDRQTQEYSLSQTPLQHEILETVRAFAKRNAAGSLDIDSLRDLLWEFIYSSITSGLDNSEIEEIRKTLLSLKFAQHIQDSKRGSILQLRLPNSDNFIEIEVSQEFGKQAREIFQFLSILFEHQMIIQGVNYQREAIVTNLYDRAFLNNRMFQAYKHLSQVLDPSKAEEILLKIIRAGDDLNASLDAIVRARLEHIKETSVEPKNRIEKQRGYNWNSGSSDSPHIKGEPASPCRSTATFLVKMLEDAELAYAVLTLEDLTSFQDVLNVLSQYFSDDEILRIIRERPRLIYPAEEGKFSEFFYGKFLPLMNDLGIGDWRELLLRYPSVLRPSIRTDLKLIEETFSKCGFSREEFVHSLKTHLWILSIFHQSFEARLDRAVQAQALADSINLLENPQVIPSLRAKVLRENLRLLWLVGTDTRRPIEILAFAIVVKQELGISLFEQKDVNRLLTHNIFVLQAAKAILKETENKDPSFFLTVADRVRDCVLDHFYGGSDPNMPTKGRRVEAVLEKLIVGEGLTHQQIIEYFANLYYAKWVKQ